MKPEGGEREGSLWSEPERRGEPRLGRDTARRTRERGGDVSKNYMCTHRGADAIGPHDGPQIRARNRHPGSVRTR